MDAYPPHLKRLARNLRTHQTEAEARLWQHLRRDQLGVRFYRQRPFGQYMLDFYAPTAKLVIELDGSQHKDDPIVRTKDELRDAWLSAQGLKVLRFDDRQVLKETQSVMEVIFKEVEEVCRGRIRPNPPFSEGGEHRRFTERFLPLEKGGQGGFNKPGINDEGET